MPTYKYTYTPGDGRDSLGSPNSRVFQEKNDGNAVAKILKENKLFLGLGGFMANERLEKGTLRKVGVKLVFTPTKEISISFYTQRLKIESD